MLSTMKGDGSYYAFKTSQSGLRMFSGIAFQVLQAKYLTL